MFDEETFRGTGNIVAPVDVDLEDNWALLQGIPSHLYIVYRGSGCDSMELWRLHNIRQVYFPFQGKRVDCWVYEHERPLWRGPQAIERTPVVNRKVYRTKKENATISLKEALKAFSDIWDQHVVEAQRAIDALQMSITQLQEEVRRLSTRMEQNGTNPVLRSDFLTGSAQNEEQHWRGGC